VPQPNDISRSLVPLGQDYTLIAVRELSQSAWLAAGIVPGVERQPLKKRHADREALLALLQRWRDEAAKSGWPVGRIVVAFEAGREGFWLARWRRTCGIEAHVIHPTSVAVSREHRWAKTDRCVVDEEDAKRPSRERENLVAERTRIVNRMKGALPRLGARKPTLRGAPERLEALRTPDNAALPPNTLAELRRDMARLRLVREQLKELEAMRLKGSEAGIRRKKRDCAHAGPGGRGRRRDRGHAGTGGALASLARPQGSGALRGADRRAGRERGQAAREGLGQQRQ
jgi:transposase